MGFRVEHRQRCAARHVARFGQQGVALEAEGFEVRTYTDGDEALREADVRARIPIAPEVDSLNVSMAAGIALAASLVGTRYLIDWLQRHRIGQPIHEDVEGHVTKAGTPTMGGVAFVTAAHVVRYLIVVFFTVYTAAGLVGGGIALYCATGRCTSRTAQPPVGYVNVSLAGAAVAP